MPETDKTTNPAAAVQDAAAAVAPDAPNIPENLAELRSEAAGHRRARREAEARSERLAAQLATYQRQEVERVAARRMHAPADLLLVTELADLIDADTGAVNVEAVEGAVASAIAERPHWANPAVDFGAGAGNGAGPSAPSIGETIKSM